MTKNTHTGLNTNPKNVTEQPRCSKRLPILATRGRQSVCVGTSLGLLHPILLSNVMGIAAMMAVLICRAQKTKNALSCRRCGNIWLFVAPRRQAQRWVHSLLLYFMIAHHITHTLHHRHHTTLGHSLSFPLACCQLRFFIIFFSLFFSWTFGGQSMLLAATPTYVPVTDSFAFYSTRVQYAPYASTCTHTITPSPPFLVSYQLTYYRRSLYTPTVS